jgi:hypothetical protein
MPATFICVDAIVEGKKVGGDNGMFITIDDTDERTCHHLLRAFLRDKGLGDANVALPDGSTVVLRCVKMCDSRLHGGRPSSDVGIIQDCIVFLSSPATLAIAKVPTKKFSFYRIRHVEARPQPTNVIVSMMAHSVSANTYLPSAREYQNMMGKDHFYNDFRD